MFEVETPSIGRAQFRSHGAMDEWNGRPVVAFGIAGSLLDDLRLIRCVPERSGVRAAA
jgi:hypothetical protein